MNMTKKETEVLSVSELTETIKRTLETSFPHLWVQGEVSNFRRQGASGHLYFTLKDANCQISAVMFRGDAAKLQRLPKEGDQVIVRGELNVYGRSGKYQIVVRTLKQAGLGELLQRLEELKAKIHKKGWFKQEYKKEIPHLPKTIGVITSPTGAAIQDILNVLGRRFSSFHLILNPVRVQGDAAAGEIIQAIKQFNDYGLADVLIVGRGGGSIEDLWAFNEESVAEAIFNSNIPIIAAVGHETDHCIAEYVADVRAPTPSAAAEMVIAEKAELSKQLNVRLRRLRQTISQILRHQKERLQMVERQPIIVAPHRLLEPWLQKIDELRDDIDQTTYSLIEKRQFQLLSHNKNLQALKPTTRIANFRQKILSREQQITQALISQLKERKHRLLYRYQTLKKEWHHRLESDRKTLDVSSLQKRCDRHMERHLRLNQERLANKKSALESVNPKSLFARGYSIVFSEKSGSAITSVQQLAIGENYRLMMAGGEAIATIKKVSKK